MLDILVQARRNAQAVTTFSLGSSKRGELATVADVLEGFGRGKTRRSLAAEPMPPANRVAAVETGSWIGRRADGCRSVSPWPPFGGHLPPSTLVPLRDRPNVIMCFTLR